MPESLDDFLSAPGARYYGDYIALLCPWHDDGSPSLLVWKGGGFRCMACGVHGSWNKLSDKLQGRKARPSSSIRGRATPYIPSNLESFVELSHNTLKQSRGRQKYLRDRGVEGMLDMARLGYYEGWYTVPVMDEYMAVRGVTLRSGPSHQKHTGLRFCNPVGQQAMMYVPDWKLWRAATEVYIVYGIFDALAMANQGFPTATTVGGKHTFRPEWLDAVRKPITIVPDEEELTDASRLAASLGWRGSVKVINYPASMKDPADLAAAGERIGDYL